MKTLIVFAHPGPARHNHQVLEDVKNWHEERKLEYEILDLYAMKYDPILKTEELYTHGNRTVSKQNKEIQKKISETNKLVFIYPVWWNNMPAILKGFFDRVFTPRFAFTFRKVIGNFTAPKALLKGKKATIFISSNSPRLIFWLILGDRARKVVCKDTLRFAGIKSKVWQLSRAEKPMDKKELKRTQNLVNRGLKWLYR